MFFVFGPGGQIYRGSPDQLAHIAPVRRVQRPQALRTRTSEAHALPLPTPAAAPPSAPTNLRTQDAVSAYAETAQGPKETRRPLTLVSDVMTRGALTVSPDLRVNDAWQQLAEHHVAQMAVVNPSGQVVGLLLRADMAPLDLLPEPGAVKQAIELARRPVSEVMITPVPTVSEDTELRRVAAVLLESDLPGLPVTDEQGRLAGFISRTDILRAVAAEPPLDLWSGPRPSEGL
jgi:CBS domain-containing protein